MAHSPSSVLVVAVVFYATLVPPRIVFSQSTAWPLQEQYEQILYSASKNVFVALRSDGRHLDTLSVEQRQVVQSIDLPLPSYRMSVGQDVNGSDVISIVHNSYVTFIRPGSENIETVFFPHGNQPVRGLLGGVGEEGLTCFWEKLDSGASRPEIVCVHPENGKFVECPHSPEEPTNIGDSFPLTMINRTIIYAFNPATEQVLKYVVGTGETPECPTFLRSYRPSWGTYGAPYRAWSSVDGSRIFLDNGLTLIASEEDDIDMRERGSFDGLFTKQAINSVAQSPEEPFLVYAYHGAESTAALAAVDAGLVASYSFPFLERMSLFELPVPNSTFIVAGDRSPEAYVQLSRNGKSIFVVTNYTDHSTQTALVTGIATVELSPADNVLSHAANNGDAVKTMP